MKTYSGESAEAFSNFINSEDGILQQDFVFESVSKYLQGYVLDAACGQGWLAGKLAGRGIRVEAFDSSAELIKEASVKFAQIPFKVADVQAELPYPENSFDTVSLNMAAHDIDDLPVAMRNLFKVLKPGGKLVITVANPYYSYPVGIWKRGLLGALLGGMPRLKVRPYFFFKNKKELHSWKPNLASRFYSLPDYVNGALAQGFVFEKLEEIESKEDNRKFNLKHRLFRYPGILTLVFKK